MFLMHAVTYFKSALNVYFGSFTEDTSYNVYRSPSTSTHSMKASVLQKKQKVVLFNMESYPNCPNKRLHFPNCQDFMLSNKIKKN